MRRAAALACVLMLGGCEHMYGAAEMAISDERAVELARRDAARRHMDLAGWPVRVSRAGDVAVMFDRPECRVGGCVHDAFRLFFVDPRGKVTIGEETH
jgi:hypothetical protein